MVASSSSGAGAEEVAIGDKVSQPSSLLFPKRWGKRIPFIDPSNPLGLRNDHGSTTIKPMTKPFALSV